MSPKPSDSLEGEQLKAYISRRHRIGQIWQSLFLLATCIGIIALMALLYNVIDSAPVAQLIRTEAARQSLLGCNGCEVDIARKAGADRILLAWVQKVSNLILNINIEVRDAETGKVVLAKSVDLRGNTDKSWQRGIDFMVRDMVENEQGNL